ncbi:MAG: YfiR family protein [gamma proteobacterium symbiont of Taylorina sp.]|nr:YfiR family protein [gamma proteobacterium symbiont of Taylorina sp.]
MNYKKNNFLYRLKYRLSILSALIFVIMLNQSAILYAGDLQAKEYFLKSAFLYNFARLVDWPSNTFKTSMSPIRLCFIGNDSFDNALQAIQNKKANSRPLIIKRNIAVSEIPHCQILFINQSEEDNLYNILDISAQYPILTVSDLADFAHKSGHIHFFVKKNNTLSLEVNLDAIKQANLQISSRILSLAKIVKSTEDFRP